MARILTDDEAMARLTAGCGAAVMRALAVAHERTESLTATELAGRTMCSVQATRRYAMLAVRIGWAAPRGTGFVATDDGARIGRTVGFA